jgi:5-oxoprolinase (ATP-hydrolysing)
MNNLTFGDDRVQYYETIAGGAGAGADFDGCAAVQTHMTNSRLTDPEILEARFPVRLRRFAIRPNSGGSGRQRGGDGASREIEFLRPLAGAMLIRRRNGTVEDLGACARFDLQAGDVLEVHTPGGGGFGNA